MPDRLEALLQITATLHEQFLAIAMLNDPRDLDLVKANLHLMDAIDRIHVAARTAGQRVPA